MKKGNRSSTSKPVPADAAAGSSSANTTELVNRIIRGDRAALAELFQFTGRDSGGW